MSNRVQQASDVKELRLRVLGLDCADCARQIEQDVAALPQVVDAQISFATGSLIVMHCDGLGNKAVVDTVQRHGFTAIIDGESNRQALSFWRRNPRAIAAVSSGTALTAGLVAHLSRYDSLAIAFFVLAIILGGSQMLRAAANSVWRSRRLDMNALMSIAIIGAVAIGEWTEGATVVFLFALGNSLEAYTMERARGAIRTLMSLSPDQAMVKRNGQEIRVPIEDIKVGEIVTIRPGERIPVDGRVIEGSSAVDQAVITGESLPVDKSVGSELFAGTLNGSGYLEVIATSPQTENTLARIARLVQEAQSQRAPVQRLVDKFASYYTPLVIAGALAVVLVPWLIMGYPFADWFYRGLVLLVIACPCALVISTPVSIVAGISRAAASGILIKGGTHLETAGKLKVLAFDKTGTLTAGYPEVVDIVPMNGHTMAEVLEMAVAVETRSEHPLAAAVLHHVRHNSNPTGDARYRQVADFQAIAGRGARAQVGDDIGYIGNPRLFAELGLDLSPIEPELAKRGQAGQTVLLVGSDKELIGLIAVADRLRDSARETISELRRAGISRLVVLSGDSAAAARALTAEIGVDECQPELLPEDKVAAVAELQRRYGPIGMVGDGVNDAPALARADLGIVMGAAGADAALEAADIALMADDLTRIPYAIRLSRSTHSIIRQNIILSIGIKAVFLVLASVGLATLWLAILADMGTSLLVTANGMRLLRFRPSDSHSSNGTSKAIATTPARCSGDRRAHPPLRSRQREGPPALD